MPVNEIVNQREKEPVHSNIKFHPRLLPGINIDDYELDLQMRLLRHGFTPPADLEEFKMMNDKEYDATMTMSANMPKAITMLWITQTERMVHEMYEEELIYRIAQTY